MPTGQGGASGKVTPRYIKAEPKPIIKPEDKKKDAKS
jgi:hypothetical protein